MKLAELSINATSRHGIKAASGAETPDAHITPLLRSEAMQEHTVDGAARTVNSTEDNPVISPPAQARDLTGRIFGNWKVLRWARHKKRVSHYWLCRCGCGVEREVHSGNLLNGQSKSCGCKRTLPPTTEPRHGCSGTQDNHATPEYRTWVHINYRCENPKCSMYRLYGGRGIRMCERWRASFEAFLADMGQKPTAKHSIDRIDNEKGYEPGNCRWATAVEQRANRRDVCQIEFRGEKKTSAQWARDLGFRSSLIRRRLRTGWTVEDAMTTPPVSGARPGHRTRRAELAKKMKERA